MCAQVSFVGAHLCAKILSAVECFRPKADPTSFDQKVIFRVQGLTLITTVRERVKAERDTIRMMAKITIENYNMIS